MFGTKDVKVWPIIQRCSCGKKSIMKKHWNLFHCPPQIITSINICDAWPTDLHQSMIDQVSNLWVGVHLYHMFSSSIPTIADWVSVILEFDKKPKDKNQKTKNQKDKKTKRQKDKKTKRQIDKNKQKKKKKTKDMTKTAISKACLFYWLSVLGGNARQGLDM